MVSSRRFSLLLLDNLSQEYLDIFLTLFSRKEQRLWSSEEYHNALCKFLSEIPPLFFLSGLYLYHKGVLCSLGAPAKKTICTWTHIS